MTDLRKWTNLGREVRTSAFAEANPQRHLFAVKSCDLVDSTWLSVPIDREESSDIDCVRRQCAQAEVDALSRYGSGYPGNGVGVSVGYVAAEERTRFREVRTGFRCIGDITALGAVDGRRHAVPIGVATALGTVGHRLETDEPRLPELY